MPAHGAAGDFRLFWIAQSISLLGVQLVHLALPLLAISAFEATGSAVALFAGIASLPWLCLGLFVGPVVDRWSRRRTLIAVHGLRALVLGSVPLALAFDALTMGQLYTVAFVVGTLAMLFETAGRAHLPSLLGTTSEHGLAGANAKLATTDALSRIAGPGIAGAGVQLFGGACTLLASAAIHAGSALLLGRTGQQRRRASATDERKQIGSRGPFSVVFDLREGLRFTLAHRAVRRLLLADGCYTFFSSIGQAVLVFFVHREIGLNAATIGMTFTVGSAGGIIGAVLARRIGRAVGTRSSLVLGYLLRGGAFVLLPLSGALPVLAVPLLVSFRLINAFGWTLWEIHQETTQQRVTPDSLRGRVNGSVLFVARGLEAVAGFVAAGIALHLGATAVLTVVAFGAIAGIGWVRGLGRADLDPT